MRATASTVLDIENFFFDRFSLLAVEKDGALTFEGVDSLLIGIAHSENLFLTDAEKIVVETAAKNNIAGNFIEIECVAIIDHNRRIAGPSAECAFAGLHGGIDDGGTTGDAE